MRVLPGGSAPEIRELKSFLCTLARRVMVDFYRRDMLEQRGKETLEYLPEQQIPSPELQHVMLETLHQIDVMLDELGDKVQCAFSAILTGGADLCAGCRAAKGIGQLSKEVYGESH